MPSTSTWRPAALRKKKNHLLDLPNELLLLIVDALPSPCPLLVAFPTLINLSSSLLERLDVSSDSRKYAGHGGDITSWLALIHQHPVVADRIQELSVVFHNYKAPTDDRHKQCPSQILDETTEKCLALAQQFSINLESSFIDRLKVCQDEANFCLLLAVAPNIRRVHLVLEIQSPVDLADLADTFSPVFTLLRLQPRTLDGFHLCITKEQIEGPLEYAPVPCSNMASLLSTIFKLPVIKTFRISGPYDEAKGSGDYWAASLHPVNMEELSVNEDSWYRPSFIHRMLRCVSGLRRIDCEVSIDAVSWSPDGYKLYERALRPHQNTLVSLRLVIPSRFETQPKLYDWVYEQPSLGSLRNFTQLKRLEVSPCVLWDAYDIGIASVGPAGDPETLSINYEGEYAYPHMAHLELQDILPPSLHSFCVTWIDANVSKKLQDFIQYLVDTGDSPFADFAHLCDLCDFDRATAEQAINHDLEFIPAQGIQQLLRNAQDLSIKTFPEDSATFARTPFVNGEVRKNTKFPQDVHCVGGCR